MVRFFPLIFIFLWSSAFITGKVVTVDASPFAALCFRFTLVTLGFFLYSLIKRQQIIYPIAETSKAMATGILFHGIYLGGCWFALSKGIPAGIVALIVTLQPILTSSLAGPILGEIVTWRQWVGILLGFGGTLIVLGIDSFDTLPSVGILASFVALIAITVGTLWQKKLSYNLPLSVSNMYQAIGGCFFHIIIILFFTQPYINFSQTFLIAISHQILLVSFGAFTILMYLIKNNSASKTVSVFFLIPPISAVMAYLFLDESLAKLDILGLVLATIGVFIATRKN
jgi:drug/metabolite transporter (DMT)-like permease